MKYLHILIYLLSGLKFTFNHFSPSNSLFKCDHGLRPSEIGKTVLISKSVNINNFVNIRTVRCLSQRVDCTFKFTKKLDRDNLG